MKIVEEPLVEREDIDTNSVLIFNNSEGKRVYLGVFLERMYRRDAKSLPNTPKMGENGFSQSNNTETCYGFINLESMRVLPVISKSPKCAFDKLTRYLPSLELIRIAHRDECKLVISQS